MFMYVPVPELSSYLNYFLPKPICTVMISLLTSLVVVQRQRHIVGASSQVNKEQTHSAKPWVNKRQTP